jgi:hypothetical protein
MSGSARHGTQAANQSLAMPGEVQHKGGPTNRRPRCTGTNPNHLEISGSFPQREKTSLIFITDVGHP